jgi:hypothetical protein
VIATSKTATTIANAVFGHAPSCEKLQCAKIATNMTNANSKREMSRE